MSEDFAHKLIVETGVRAHMHTQTHFVPVTTVDMLEQLFVRSQDMPVLLFNHDKGCPISATAYFQMLRLKSDIPLIDVTIAKDITHTLVQRTGVRHESPQVIILRHGRAVWFASHFAITSVAVFRSLQEYS